MCKCLQIQVFKEMIFSVPTAFITSKYASFYNIIPEVLAVYFG